MTPQEIKHLNLEQKIEYFRNLFSDLDNENEFDVLNVFRLINSYNIFDDDFFEHEGSYISDISEFIDIKMALNDEIKDFSLVLVTWYLSILRSCDVKNIDDDRDSKVELPLFIHGLFVNATLPMMSALMNSIDLSLIDMTELHKVNGAFIILSRLFNTHAFVASYLETL